jgi:hypothetical protein
MKRAVISKRSIATMLVVAAAALTAGVGHAAPTPIVAKALVLCPPAC